MAAIFAFRCSCCGELHEGAPSIGFDAPHHYAVLNETERDTLATLGSDLCTIDHDEGRDHFVRACLEIPIHGHGDPFIWGVWISLSAENFARYQELPDTPPPGESYFAAENPKGELGFYFRSKGGGYPDRMYIRAPSFSNLQILAPTMEGHYLPDTVAILGSFDFVMGECDR